MLSSNLCEACSLSFCANMQKRRGNIISKSFFVGFFLLSVLFFLRGVKSETSNHDIDDCYTISDVYKDISCESEMVGFFILTIALMSFLVTSQYTLQNTDKTSSFMSLRCYIRRIFNFFILKLEEYHRSSITVEISNKILQNYHDTNRFDSMIDI